jgi:hypothetical protein
MQVNKERGKKEGTEVFLSPRKHINILKRATNLNDFQNNVLDYIKNGNYLLSKK